MRRQFLHDDRLFPADSATRAIAQRLFKEVRDLPIVSPHGHTQAQWFATNDPFPDPARLFIVPDHYVFRMLYSQGMKLEDLGVGTYGATPEAQKAISTRGACGAFLRSIIIYFAGLRRGYGSTTFFRISSI